MADQRGSSRSRHGVWTHWVPLALTLTIATAGVVGWAWRQRKDSEDEHDGLDYSNGEYGDNPAYGNNGNNNNYRPGPGGPPAAPGQPGYDGIIQRDLTGGQHDADHSQAGWGARMSGALRRTPSPQQFFDSAGKTVAAAGAAAGAVMGKALASIREEDQKNPWSEEADAKKGRSNERSGPVTGKRRKTVAIVISADTKGSSSNDDGFHEHASVLSHIPRSIDYSETKLFVLIYAPDLKDPTTDATSNPPPPPSLGSSYSNIGFDQVQTPGENSKDPLAAASTSPEYNAIHAQALPLVERESMILPFTSGNGHSHILRHLNPEVIYLQESLAGDNGSIVANLQTWLRHDIIVVVGAESGSGGLADSESEAEQKTKETKWWQKPERVGRGRGVVVVDSIRVHDDWAKRIQGRE